jgi:hypothetical protein
MFSRSCCCPVEWTVNLEKVMGRRVSERRSSRTTRSAYRYLDRRSQNCAVAHTEGRRGRMRLVNLAGQADALPHDLTSRPGFTALACPHSCLISHVATGSKPSARAALQVANVPAFRNWAAYVSPNLVFWSFSVILWILSVYQLTI